MPGVGADRPPEGTWSPARARGALPGTRSCPSSLRSGHELRHRGPLPRACSGSRSPPAGVSPHRSPSAAGPLGSVVAGQRSDSRPPAASEDRPPRSLPGEEQNGDRKEWHDAPQPCCAMPPAMLRHAPAHKQNRDRKGAGTGRPSHVASCRTKQNGSHKGAGTMIGTRQTRAVGAQKSSRAISVARVALEGEFHLIAGEPR